MLNSARCVFQIGRLVDEVRRVLHLFVASAQVQTVVKQLVKKSNYGATTVRLSYVYRNNGKPLYKVFSFQVILLTVVVTPHLGNVAASQEAFNTKVFH